LIQFVDLRAAASGPCIARSWDGEGGLACKMAMRGGVAKSALSTYLGASAGERVLSGQIKRCDGETTRAAIEAQAETQDALGHGDTIGFLVLGQHPTASELASSWLLSGWRSIGRPTSSPPATTSRPSCSSRNDQSAEA
jgi:hypothetical protein